MSRSLPRGQAESSVAVPERDGDRRASGRGNAGSGYDTSQRAEVLSLVEGLILGAIVYLAAAGVVFRFLPDAHPLVLIVVHGLTVFVGTGTLTYFFVLEPRRRDLVEHHLQLARQRDQLLVETGRRDFAARLNRALDMSDDEPAVMRTLERALHRLLPGAPAEVLLPAPGKTTLAVVAEAPSPGEGPRCPVPGGECCPALREATTLVFESADELDACPHLAGRAGSGVAAVCVPVNVTGHATGVIHALVAEEADADLDPVVLEDLRLVARTVGTRITMLRVFAETRQQASTDPLTGLLNRRSFEHELRREMRQDRPFALVMADLDHFKNINDSFGHDVGDRALRVFAEVLLSSLRPDDVICRYGGEEFVIVLPGNNEEDATRALERVRIHLAGLINRADLPHFTCSFGVAEWNPGLSGDEVLVRADLALLAAKHRGRDRIVRASELSGVEVGRAGPALVPHPTAEDSGGPAQVEETPIVEAG